MRTTHVRVSACNLMISSRNFDDAGSAGRGEKEEERVGYGVGYRGKREMEKRAAGRENDRARPRVGQGRRVSVREFLCKGWIERKRMDIERDWDERERERERGGGNERKKRERDGELETREKTLAPAARWGVNFLAVRSFVR